MDFFGREHPTTSLGLTEVGARWGRRASLFVERYYTTASSHPHRSKHNFWSALNQPVDVKSRRTGRADEAAMPQTACRTVLLNSSNWPQLVKPLCERDSPQIAQTASHLFVPSPHWLPEQLPLLDIN